MKNQLSKLPVLKVAPAHWSDPEVEIWEVIETDMSYPNAKQGRFNVLYTDSQGQFFLAARTNNMPKDLIDIPFSAFRQVDVVTALRWMSDVYEHIEEHNCSLSGDNRELLDAAIELLEAKKFNVLSYTNIEASAN